MRFIQKILLATAFLLSSIISAQDEKLPSYFSDQLQFNNIQQIGTIDTNLLTKSQERTSTILLKQIGDENIANIDNKLAQGEHKVYQIGNENNYQFLNYRNNLPINLGVLQTGNSNSLRIIGTNSMFRNLRITQFGGARMSITNY